MSGSLIHDGAGGKFSPLGFSITGEPVYSTASPFENVSSDSFGVGSLDTSAFLSQMSESIYKAFQDMSTSALKAEKESAADANALTYKMFKEGQQFNADEALKAFERSQTSANKAMDFEKSERLASQDWYKMLSDTSYQRAVSDLKAAGLNPALALSGLSGASSAMSSGASGSTASANAANSSGGSASKANASSAMSVNANLIGKVLAALVSMSNTESNNATQIAKERMSLQGSAIRSLFSLFT